MQKLTLQFTTTRYHLLIDPHFVHKVQMCTKPCTFQHKYVLFQFRIPAYKTFITFLTWSTFYTYYTCTKFQAYSTHFTHIMNVIFGTSCLQCVTFNTCYIIVRLLIQTTFYACYTYIKLSVISTYTVHFTHVPKYHVPMLHMLLHTFGTQCTMYQFVPMYFAQKIFPSVHLFWYIYINFNQIFQNIQLVICFRILCP
eukprot:TRINITY_DN5009_c0_g2_i2.p1 TRINITY_DN5009_c0_g2~~TRINITY_DN5009_c0_g2_i2.p1  ORF type:complete len:209 (+),score=-31.28 TRINITY_DN5009_c0_g2_i2:37-627(+)